MRLRSFQIKDLYGRFNYNIDFDNPEDIVILTAPNGFGKTAVISIIESLFARKLERLAKYRFSAATFIFEDDVIINLKPLGQESFLGDDESFNLLNIETIFPQEEPENWQFDIRQTLRRLSRPVERYLPFIHYTGESYYDAQYDENLSYMELMERYSDELPPSFERIEGHRPKFNEVIDSVNCHVIETDRLLKSNHDSRKRTSVARNVTAVDENARDLASKISSATQAFAGAAQRLDQTFPERVLQYLSGAPPEGRELRARLNALEERRAELSEYGLVEKSESTIMGYEPRLADPAVRSLLSLYVNDSEKKLSTFDSLYAKISLLAEICNAHFSFKRMVVNAESGMEIFDDMGKPIPLSSLSSGEQHILVLNYDLLFRVENDPLILVDEPELSLHVAWQKRFISDLQMIQRVQPMSVVIATHSPQIINDRWDLEEALEMQQ